MAQPRLGRSLAEDAYLKIRSQVLLGQIPPGTKLVLKDLAAEYDVSLSVIREAVTRLASERLLVATPQHGFAVQDLSLEDLADVTWMRVQIETIALRESITRGDLNWEVDLVASHHALQATEPMGPDQRLNPQWTALHSAFHAALTAGAQSAWLANIRQQLFDASELYRYWSVMADATSANPTRRLRRVRDQHKALLDAALARDADTACAIITRHFEETAAVLAKNAPPHPPG